MLLTNRVAQVLEERREAFRRAAEESGRLRELYLRSLERLPLLSCSEIEERLADEPWPGARPSGELQERGLIVPFEPRWSSAEDARSWAVGHLRGIPTVAVDGSQIAASKEFGVPISLVQVAWFENYHDPQRRYVKDVVNDVITPSESADEVDEYLFAESKLNQRRFALEMEVAVERICVLDPASPPVVFVDGSFVLSFIGRMNPQARPAYLHALFSLLDASRRYRIPVIGYVDLSLASDLVTMLRTLFDRTAAFRCARVDVLPHYRTPEHDYTSELYFVYLKTGADRLPARIDFPGWMLEAGLLDHVLDVIRAEAVVGSGYPYALETADATAVLTSEDRMTFYRLFHDYAHATGLNVLLPGKSISKAHRR